MLSIFSLLVIPILVGYALHITVFISPLSRVAFIDFHDLWSMGIGITIFYIQTVLFGQFQRSLNSFKAETDRIRRDGWRNPNLTRIMRNLVIPIMFQLVCFNTLPFLLSNLILRPVLSM